LVFGICLPVFLEIRKVKHFPVKIKICFMFACLVLGGMASFSMIDACPVEKVECDKQREAVSFPHDMHMGSYDCEDCHHVYDENKNNVLDAMELYSGNPDIMCSSCHASGSKIHTRQAFHRQCIGCHNEAVTMDQASAPTMCNECHHPVGEASTDDEMIIRG